MAQVTLSAAGLEAIYAQMPQIACRKKCRECCSLIIMSRSEWRRIREETGEDFPKADMERLECGWLTAEGTCAHHALRPGICRLWGVTESMRCPFGCELLPARTGPFKEHPRLLKDHEAHRFLLRLGSDTLGPLSEADAEQVLRSIERQRATSARRHPPA